MAKHIHLRFDRLTDRDPTFRVFVESDHNKQVGTVRDFYIRHMKRRGWEATSATGEHLGVHNTRLEAAWALTWDRQGYPFPVHPSHLSKMTYIG